MDGLSEEIHFARRWRERGRPDVVDGQKLCEAIRQLYKAGRLDVVFRDGGHPFVRFRIAGQSYYSPIAEDGWPKTVYDHERFRQLRERRKRQRPTRRRTWKYSQHRQKWGS